MLRRSPSFLWRCLKTWNDNYSWSLWMRWHEICLISRGFRLEYVFSFIACRNCKDYKMGISNIRDPFLNRHDKDSLNSKAVSFGHTSMSKYVVLNLVTLNNSKTKVYSIWILLMFSMLSHVFRQTVRKDNYRDYIKKMHILRLEFILIVNYSIELCF